MEERCNAFCPFQTSTKKRKDMNVLVKSKFESEGVQCRYNFSKKCRSKIFRNVTYNPLKANQKDFLEQRLSDIDYASRESLSITKMGDYNLDFFTILEREKLETVILPYGFSVAGPILPTRICITTEKHW